MSIVINKTRVFIKELGWKALYLSLRAFRNLMISSNSDILSARHTFWENLNPSYQRDYWTWLDMYNYMKQVKEQSHRF